MKINWGYKLVISLVLFAGIMATMVTLAMKERVDLVSKDYYKKEIEYQDQIDSQLKTIKESAIKFDIDDSNKLLRLKFQQYLDSGEIHLFRPSNAAEDVRIQLQTDEHGNQVIPFTNLNPGFWRIKINWISNSESYYFEKEMNL